MARCDQGYLCQVCGKEVEAIIESELYLRFVIGQIDPETLHTSPERHLRCNPVLAQFIVDPRFDPPVVAPPPFSREELDLKFVEEQTKLMTAGYARLWEIFNEESPPPIHEYPLPEFASKWSVE